MELWYDSGQHPFGTWTNNQPEFSVPPLRGLADLADQEQVIEARIFAVNSHGRSDAVSLRLAQQKLSPDQLSIETGKRENFFFFFFFFFTNCKIVCSLTRWFECSVSLLVWNFSGSCYEAFKFGSCPPGSLRPPALQPLQTPPLAALFPATSNTITSWVA